MKTQHTPGPWTINTVEAVNEAAPKLESGLALALKRAGLV